MSQHSPSVDSPSDEQTEHAQSMAGCLAHLVWSLGGLGTLFVLWVTILRNTAWTFTLRDVFYGITVTVMIGARHLHVFRYHGRVGSGGVATPRDFWRYAVMLLLVSVAMWIVAQSFRV